MGDTAASGALSPTVFIKLATDSAAKVHMASAQINRKHSQRVMLSDTNLKVTRFVPPPLPSSGPSSPGD